MLENLRDNGISLSKILMFFLVLFLIIFGLYFLISDMNNNDFLIVNENLILTKSGSKWKQIDTLDDNILDKTYHVRTLDNDYDDVIVSYDADSNSWYYMNKNYNDLNLKKVQLAYTKKFKGVKRADYDVSYYDESDDDILSDVLKDKAIDDFKKSVVKRSFDIDGDGTLETIYTLTNESLVESPGKKYSYIFLVKGDSLVKMLDDDTSTPYIVRNIIDIDNDGKYEVIVSKGDVDVSTFNSCYQIYKINGDKVKRIMDC